MRDKQNKGCGRDTVYSKVRSQRGKEIRQNLDESGPHTQQWKGRKRYKFKV